MSELHQKLAVLSSSLNSTSPQLLTEQQVTHGNVVFTPTMQTHQVDNSCQMVVDSTTPIGQQQQQYHQVPQQGTQMQTVVVNHMLSNSSSVSPMVLNVPANNGQMISANTGLQQGQGGILIPVHANILPAPVAPMQNMTCNQPAVHPSLVTATQSPNIIHSPSIMTAIHPSNHQINELANHMTSTTPTTTIVTTNKLIEAVTHQGVAGAVVSVSIRTRSSQRERESSDR